MHLQDMASSLTNGCSTYPPISNHAFQSKAQCEESGDGIFNQGDIWISNINTPPISIYEEVCTDIPVAEECCSSSCSYQTLPSSHQALHATAKQPTKFDIFTPKEMVPLNETEVNLADDYFVPDDQDIDLTDEDHCGNCYKRFKIPSNSLHHSRKSECEGNKSQKRLTSCRMPQHINVKKKQSHFNQKITKNGIRSDRCSHCCKKLKTAADVAFHRCKKKYKVDKWKNCSTTSTQVDKLCLKKRRPRSNHKLISENKVLDHTIKEQYKCSECGKSFLQESLLKRHLMIHTGERPYKCTYCEKSFAHSATLKVHIRCHTGERPYKCSDCGKSFTQQCTLKHHKLTHTGERPYKCSYCDKAFRQLGAMKSHTMRLHSRKK